MAYCLGNKCTKPHCNWSSPIHIITHMFLRETYLSNLLLLLHKMNLFKKLQNHCRKEITVPVLSSRHFPYKHASINALPSSEHKSSPMRPRLSHRMLIADFILKAIPPVVSTSEVVVFRLSDTLPSSLT